MSRFGKQSGILPIERITDSVPVVDSNHAQVHEGNAYVPVIEASLANGATEDILMYVPAGTYVHFQSAMIQTEGGGATVKVYKDAVYASFADDASVAPVNRDHIDNSASALEFQTQSPTSDGTLVEKIVVLSAGKGTSGVAGSTTEMIFKPDTLVLFRITNLETSTNNITFMPFWYEETSG